MKDDASHAPNPLCDCAPCVKWDRDRLRRMLDSRPALNAGLVYAYTEWSQGVYLSDALAYTDKTSN